MSQRLIITVCRGNIGRSPFAEAVIKQRLVQENLSRSVQVISRGVQGTAVDPKPVSFPNMTYYEDMYRDAKPTLDKFGVDMSKHASKPINADDAARADILLAMDSKTRSALLGLFPAEAHKVHLLSELVGSSHDITDPEGASGPNRQRQIFTEIHDILTAGFPELVRMLNAIK